MTLLRHPELADRLQSLGFASDDFVVQDDSDGKGPYLAAWRSDAQWPSQAEIDAAPSFAVQNAWSSLRAERNARLAACDWTQLPDADVDATAWRAYRTALRDLPESVTDPTDVTWPSPPG